MVEILIALPVQAANPFVAFIALVAFFFGGADRAERRAALTRIVLSASLVVWAVTLTNMGPLIHDPDAREAHLREALATMEADGTPSITAAICLLIIYRRRRRPP